MSTVLRRTLIALLAFAALAAVAWRLTIGTPAALGDLAERRAREAPQEEAIARTLRAERDVVTATGTQDPRRVVKLVALCQEAVRGKLARYPYVELDEGVRPGEGYIYTFRYRDRRYVGLMKSAPRDGSEDARQYPPLHPPLSGRYDVDGYVKYSKSPLAAGSPYEHSSYTCVVTVDGTRFDVGDVEFRVVK